MREDAGEQAPPGGSGIKGLVAFLLFAAAAVALSAATPVGEVFRVDNISRIAGHLGAFGPLAIILLGLLTPLLFAPRWPIAFVSGLLYGITAGTALSTFASLLGAWLQYHMAGSLLAGAARRVVRRLGGRAAPLSKEHSFLSVFILRVFPLSNFVATNLLAGALRVKLGPYLLATFIGMLPSSIIYAAWGKLVKKPSVEFYVFAVAGVCALTAATVVAQRRLRRRMARAAAEARPGAEP